MILPGKILQQIKTIVKLGIGMAICRVYLFNRYKEYLLATWAVESKRKKIDKIFYPFVLSYWLKSEYLAENDPDKRELLKELLMGREGGIEWAKHYDSCPIDCNKKVGHLKYSEACPLLFELNETLNLTKEETIVIQVGSSSGKQIAWLAEKNPKHLFIGTDIYPNVIDYSSGSHKLPNLIFMLKPAHQIIEIVDKYQKYPVIIFSFGSLQYVQPEHVEIFFKSLERTPGLKIMLLEPADEEPGELKRSRWRGDFSYAHGYRSYAEEAGFITDKHNIIRPYFPYEDFPQHKGTVHYYYITKTTGGLGDG